MTCSVCAHWVQWVTDTRGEDMSAQNVGECHRYPPREARPEGPAFVMVPGTTFCGEFALRGGAVVTRDLRLIG